MVASNVDNTAEANAELDQLLRRRTQEIEVDPGISVDHLRIRAWSDVYRTFEFKEARRLHPSIWQLVSRIKEDNSFYLAARVHFESHLTHLPDAEWAS